MILPRRKISLTKLIGPVLSLYLFLSLLTPVLPVYAWQTSDIPVYVSTIGGYTADGQLNLPVCVSIDASNNVYVADYANNRIQKFTSSGTFLTKWGSYGSSDGQFMGPSGIAVDSSGNIYVADSNNNRIQKFTSAGVFIAKWGSYGTGNGQFKFPSGVTVDTLGNVYVTDNGNHRVEKFDSTGTFLAKWGSGGSGNGQFSYPTSIVADISDNIYVADNNARIQKFTSAGVFLTKWGSSGTGDGQFDNTPDVTTDASGNVYVADRGNNRIQKFTSAGVFLTKWGSSGTGDGQFDNPMGVSTDVLGNVYVADAYNYRIEKFTSSGDFLVKWGSNSTGDGYFDTPSNVTVDSFGNIYVADTSNNRIQKFTSSGVFITKWGSYGTGDSQFDNPTGIAIDSFGNIYVADTYNERIQKFTSSGVFITKWGNTGSENGQFYMDISAGITIDTFGNVYVVDTWNYRIQKFTSSGVFITKWGSSGTGNGQFNLPGCVSIDASNNVYVTDWGSNRIQKFTSTGGFLTKWGSYGTGDGQFRYPNGIFVDTSGNVYVADTSNNRIQKFTSSGVFITKWGSYGTGDSQFSRLTDVSVDTFGNVYVVDSGNHRIQKFTFDTIPPVISFSSATVTNNTRSNILGTAADALTAVSSVEYQIDSTDGSWVACTATDGTFNSLSEGFTCTSAVDLVEGTHVIYVRATDSMTNTNNSDNYGQFSFTVDLIAPTGTIKINNDATYTNTTAVNLNLTATDNLGIPAQMMAGNTSDFTGVTWETYTTTKSWTLTTGDGTKTVYVKFKDQAGNVSEVYSDTIILDETLPTGSVSINSGDTYITTSDVSLTLSAVDVLSGVSQMMLSNISDFTGSSWESYTTTKSWTLSSGDGTKTVYVKFKDMVGNISEVYNDTIILDETAPTDDISINGDIPYTNSRNVTLTINATDALSGVYQMMISEDSSFNEASWEDYATSKSFTLSTTDGIKTVYVKFKDTAGNVSEVYSDSIILDTTLPIGSITLNSNAIFTTTIGIILTLSATDALSGVSQMMVSESQDFGGASWETHTTLKTYTLESSTTDGTKTVYVKFKDQAGNVSEVYSDTIIYDSNPPSDEISINSNATYTKVREVTLTISVTDVLSGVSQMMISEDSAFTGADWETYAVTKTWTLSSGDGTKIIYIKFKDLAGNISSIFHDSIILDTTQPSLTLLKLNGKDFTADITTWEVTSTKPPFSGTTDPNATVTITITPGTIVGTVTADAAGIWSWTPATDIPQGEHTVTITTTDGAGNTTSYNFTLKVVGVSTTGLPDTGNPYLILLATILAFILSGAGLKFIPKLDHTYRHFKH